MSEKASDFEVVATGQAADVRLAPAALKEYRKLTNGRHELSVRQYRQLKRYMDNFCETGGKSLNDEQYKREGLFSDGKGGRVSVWTFKPFKWRLYGSVLNVAGKQTFVGVRVDPAKKQTKADRTELEAAAKLIGQLREHVGGSE